jgi:hypothetical protein
VLPAARDLIEAVWNSLTSTSAAVGAMTEGMLPRLRDDVEPGPLMQLETARHDHSDAKKLADDLHRVMRETPN